MTSEQEKNLRESDLFVSLISNEYVNSAEALVQMTYAVTLKKPFFVILVKDINIPEDSKTLLNEVHILETYTIPDASNFTIEKALDWLNIWLGMNPLPIRNSNVIQ